MSNHILKLALGLAVKIVDTTAMLTWWAMGLGLVLGLAAMAMRPAPTFYGSDTGLCDTGCSDFR